MKKVFYLFFIGLLSFTSACSDADTKTDDEKDEKDNKEEIVEEKEENCELKLTDFRTFCGITAGDTYEDVVELYGEPDKTSPVDEDSYWAYYFTNSSYPLTVEVHEGDNKIWTVYMEILSIDNMDSDIATAEKLLNMDECQAALLGEDITKATELLGKNYSYEAKDSYDTYIYDTDDLSLEVVLDYYYEQYTKCTRIMVYFFDQLPSE